MPKRKITLDEAYAVFEEHNLRVKVEAITQHEPIVPDVELFEQPERREIPQSVGKHTVRVVLHARHSVSTGGEPIYDSKGKMIRVDGAGTTYYGPGPCYVPAKLAGDLLHQDMLARQADRDFRSGTFKSKIVVPVIGGHNIAVQVSDDPMFDMSGFLGMVGNGLIPQFKPYHVE